MSKPKTHGKDKKKSAQLVLRVDKAERDDFVALCERLDTTAAREIRRFMRDWVASHAQTPPIAADEPAAPAPTPEAALEPAPTEPTVNPAPAKRKKRAAS